MGTYWRPPGPRIAWFVFLITVFNFYMIYDWLAYFLIQGWLDNAGSYDKLIPLLPKDLHIVVVETPGHGLSDPYPPDLAYNALDSVIAIERLRRQLKWQKFSIIGHSMGGVCAMLYAGIFPERLEKVVMLDIARVQITLSETVDARLRKTVGKLLKYEEAIIAGQEKPISYEEAVQKAIEGSFGSLNEEACDIMFKRGLKKVEGGYIFRRDRRLLAAPLGFYPKADQLELARKVTADVLLIKYKDGPIFEPMENFMEHVEALKTSSKNVRFVQVDGSHHAHLTHPERVAPIISEFFRL